MADILIAPSIRSADWTRLGKEVKDLEKAGADMLHFDVADGHFINDLAIGPKLIAVLRKITQLSFDVHLMFKNPENIIPKYVEAGADIIMVHAEGNPNTRQHNKKAGIALKIETSIEEIKDFLPIIDKINVMGIDLKAPGKFVSSVLGKIVELDRLIKEMNLNVCIQADGAVSMDTRIDYEKAGARSLVVGYPIFSRKGEYTTAIEEIRTGIKK